MTDTFKNINWPEHFQVVLAERRVAFDAKMEFLEEKITQNARDSTEGLRRAENDLRRAQEEMERRLIEKSQERDRSSERDRDVINEKFETIYGFRDRLLADRPTFVTRDQLETTKKGITDQLDILQRAITISSGRDTGMSRVGGWIVSGFAIIAAIGTIITGASVFFIHAK